MFEVLWLQQKEYQCNERNSLKSILSLHVGICHIKNDMLYDISFAGI